LAFGKLQVPVSKVPPTPDFGPQLNLDSIETNIPMRYSCIGGADMIDLLKKGALLGLGFLAFSKEKAEALADELIKRGEAEQSKRSETVSEILNKAKEFEADIEKRIEAQIAKTLEKLNIPTKKDFDDLAKEVKALSKKMDSK
jgi:polyhydroxyalkanoate synthesis regulator phasin